MAPPPPYRPIAIYLNPTYLARTLSAAERLQCHHHHYAFLCETLSPFSLRDIFGTGVELFSRASETATASCRLAVAQKAANQGELALTLLLEGEEIYALGFNFVPGALFSAPAVPAILVSRMQGAAQSFEPIRAATKLFADIAPQALLFAALQGVADGFGVRFILGVPGRLQPSRKSDNAELLQRHYDDFFASLGAEPLAAGFYAHDRAAVGDILDNLPAKHRARTKTKRRLKAEIAAEVAEILRKRIAPPAPPGRAWHFLAEHFSTRVGERRGDAIATTGRSGCLMFGPYVYLEAGEYEVAFVFEAASAEGVVEATADHGRMILARRALGAGAPATLTLSLAQPCDDIEFRVFVEATSACAVRGVSVRALSAAETLRPAEVRRTA